MTMHIDIIPIIDPKAAMTSCCLFSGSIFLKEKTRNMQFNDSSCFEKNCFAKKETRIIFLASSSVYVE